MSRVKALAFWRKKTQRRDTLVNSVEELDARLIRRLNRWKLPSIGQLRYIPRLLSSEEKRMLLVSSVALVLILAALGARLWIRNTVAVPRVGGTYTEGLVGSPRFINPVLTSGSDVDRDLTSLVFSGLVKIGRDGSPEPDLAKSWTVSDDRKVYTVQLRDNVFWHDGEPLTVDDVLYTIRTIQAPETKSPLRLTFAGVDMRPIDNATITFTLKEPFPSFLEALTVGILPEHVWYSIPVAQAHLAEINTKPVGTGPFKFKSLTKDASGSIRTIVLTRNERYHGQKAFIQDLAFKFYGDVETAIEALKNKNVDGLGFLPLEYHDELAGIKTINLKRLDLNQYNAIFFNATKNEALKDRAVRKALALAVDRDRIVRDVLGGNGISLAAPTIPGFEYNTSSSPFDMGQAASLLDKAGWKINATSTVRMKGTAELSVLLTAVDQPEQMKTVQIIKEVWDSLGVKTEIQTIAKGKIKNEVIEPRAYQALLFGQIINSNQDIFAFWHSSQNRYPGSNLAVLANKDIDATLEKIRSSVDHDELAKLYQSFIEKEIDEQFAIVLYSPQYLYPLSSAVKGVDAIDHITSPSDRFATITSWYLKTSRRPH